MKNVFNKLWNTTKGQNITLSGLVTIAVLITAGVLILTFSGQIVRDVQLDAMTSDGGFNCNAEAQGEVNCTSAAYNVTKQGGIAFVNLSGQFGNMGTVIAAGLIIVVLLGAFVVVTGGLGGNVKFT